MQRVQKGGCVILIPTQLRGIIKNPFEKTTTALYFEYHALRDKIKIKKIKKHELPIPQKESSSWPRMRASAASPGSKLQAAPAWRSLACVWIPAELWLLHPLPARIRNNFPRPKIVTRLRPRTQCNAPCKLPADARGRLNGPEDYNWFSKFMLPGRPNAVIILYHRD